MKKISFVVLFVVSFSVSHAQAQFGVKAGFNLSSFNASFVPDVSYSQKSNFNAGLILSLPLGSGFSIQPEAFYSGEGADINTTNLNGVYSYQMLNIPVLLKYKSPFHIFAETGPQAGFLLGATIQEEQFPSTDIKDQTKSPCYSWVFGLGDELSMGLGLDVRYSLALTDIAKSGSNTYNDGSIKSSVFQWEFISCFQTGFPLLKTDGFKYFVHARSI